MTKTEYDLAIIGSGPGGYVAAIRASQLGLKTAIIEKDKLGGVCLNIGCIPSKSLLHQAEVFRSMKELNDMGVKTDASNFDYAKVHGKSRVASDTLSSGVAFLLKKNNVEVITGTAKLKSKTEISIDGSKTISCKNIIIATGSRPRSIPNFDFDGENILSSNDILNLTTLPKRLLILGSGAIGCEFSQVFSSFSTEVHLVEMLDRIAPIEDKALTDVLAKSFKDGGINILTSTKALSHEVTKAGVKVKLEDSKGKELEIEVDKVLVATGRIPNTENLGLEDLGIKTERGFITTGDYYKTTVPNIYAIGDVVDSPQLAHVASKEGEIAVEYIAGKTPEKRIAPDEIPGVIYTDPEISSFGKSEEELKKEKIPYISEEFPYRGIGKAVAVEHAGGKLKILVHKETGEILWAGAVGASSSELIHELLLAKTSELIAEDLATMIHAHPTLSEGVMELARAAEGWAIHK